MDVYSRLGACEGFLKDAASEVYCTTIRGRWCFLPGIMWLTLGRWRLPKDVRVLPGPSVQPLRKACSCQESDTADPVVQINL
jgi:hypothetical protein